MWNLVNKKINGLWMLKTNYRYIEYRETTNVLIRKVHTLIEIHKNMHKFKKK